MVHLLLFVKCFYRVFLSDGFILTQPLLDYDQYVHQTKAKILPLQNISRKRICLLQVSAKVLGLNLLAHLGHNQSLKMWLAMEMEFRLARSGLPSAPSTVRDGFQSHQSYSNWSLECGSFPKRMMHRTQAFIHDTCIHLETQGVEYESNLPHVTK